MDFCALLVVTMHHGKKEEQKERDHYNLSERSVIIPRRNISQVLHSQSTNGDGCCKRQLPSYWNRTPQNRLLSRKPSFVHALTASSFPGFPRANQEEDRCHELSEMKGGHFWVHFESQQALLHSGCRYCPLIWQGRRPCHRFRT